MRMEWIPCNACGRDDFRELAVLEGWHIGECAACALVHVNPVPFFDPDQHFAETSRSFQYTRFQHQLTPAMLAHDERQFGLQCQEAARVTGRDLSRGRLLDVGCGSGGIVHAATRAGWEAVGVDIDPTLVAEGRARLGVDLRCGTLPDPRLPAGRFTFVRMRDVIEHLPNPLEVLVEARRLLAPGGVLLVATPNEGGLPSRIRHLLGRHTTVATVPPPHHLHGFTPDTLSRILARAGLVTLGVFTTTPVDPAYVTARNAASTAYRARLLVWRAAVHLGMGSMLVAWAEPPRA